MVEGRTFYLLDPAQAVFCAIEVSTLGAGIINAYLGCEAADSIRFDERHLLFFDDEGLRNGISHYTAIEGYPDPLGGRLILAPGNDLIASRPLISMEKALARFRCYRSVMDPIIDQLCVSKDDVVSFISAVSGFRTRIEPVSIRIVN